MVKKAGEQGTSWMRMPNATEVANPLGVEVITLLSMAHHELIDEFFQGTYDPQYKYASLRCLDFNKELDGRGISVSKVAESKPQDSDDEGERDCWIVWEFKNKNIDSNQTAAVKFFGITSSYDGAEFEGFRLVKPKQKTITVYE